MSGLESYQAEKKVGSSTTDDTTNKQLDFSNTLIGIPAYNEEVGIGSVVLMAKQLAENVLVVDDGSVDSTPEIARKAGATVIEHDENQGKGAAVRTIFNHTLQEQYEALVLLDGDGQHMPEDIPNVAGPVLEGESDIVIGSRYLEEEKTETPLYRRFGQKVLDYATMGSAGQSVSDSQSGFRAFSNSAVQDLTIRTDGIGVESEMISDATRKDLEIAEVPIDVKYEEVDGQTYNPLRHGLSVFMFVLQLVRDRHPLLFFGLPGLLLMIAGGSVMLHSAMIYESTGSFHQWRVVISGFAITVGLLALFCGLVLNQVANMIQQGDQ